MNDIIDADIDERSRSKLSRYTMKARRSKVEAKPITITAERLSDKSRITFTISSDKTIEQLRALLNHHLPPLSPDRFDLYSYQRGALIHFHPSSFKLDYFPVIFDQSVLLLKMDDQLSTSELHLSPKTSRKQRKPLMKYSLLSHFLSSSKSSSPNISRKSSSVQQQPINNTLVSSSPSPSPSSSSSSTSSSSSSSSSSITCLSFFKQIFHQSSSKQTNKCGETNVLTY